MLDNRGWNVACKREFVFRPSKLDVLLMWFFLFLLKLEMNLKISLKCTKKAIHICIPPFKYFVWPGSAVKKVVVEMSKMFIEMPRRVQNDG